MTIAATTTRRLLGATRNMASLQRYKPEFNNSWLGSRPWLYSRELKRVHKDDYVPKQHLKRVTARREEKRRQQEQAGRQELEIEVEAEKPTAAKKKKEKMVIDGVKFTKWWADDLNSLDEIVAGAGIAKGKGASAASGDEDSYSSDSSEWSDGG